MTRLVQIPIENLPEAWSHVVPFIEKMSTLTSGDYGLDDLRAQLLSGNMQLWAAIDDDGRPLAVMITQLFMTPKLTFAHILGLVGEHRDKWIHHLEEIKAWAKANGATRLRISGRKAWAKVLPEFKVTYWQYEQEII